MDAAFPPEAFDDLAKIEANSFWFQSRNKLIAWALQRYFEPPARLLEVGCGTGFVLQEISRIFKATEIWGGEFYGEGLPHARLRVPRASLLQLDATQIPFKGSFDIVCAFDVLEHIQDDATSLAEIASATRAGGGLVLTVPQHQWLWSYIDEYSFHKRRYSKLELLGKLERAGYRVQLATSFVSLLLPAMLLSRRRAAEGEHREQYQMPRILNQLFSAVMAAERQAITRGLRLPVGGSLLVVARRKLD